jgi:hypothetical protein
MTRDKDRKAAVRVRMAVTGEPYAEAARQIRGQPGAGAPYGYDPAADTLRVSRYDLAKLLLQFQEEPEHAPGRQCRTWPITTSRSSVSPTPSNTPAGTALLRVRRSHITSPRSACSTSSAALASRTIWRPRSR